MAYILREFRTRREDFRPFQDIGKDLYQVPNFLCEDTDLLTVQISV